VEVVVVFEDVEVFTSLLHEDRTLKMLSKISEG
jgi:hypothetical protein